ncbi:MAG: hypothetical protein JNM22_08895 [Saprospiraceae bacterium]|nr:hypothetical protein [Saprospiraceae bacterium]
MDLTAYGGTDIESIFYKASKNQHRSIASFHVYTLRIHPPKAVLIRKNQKEVAERPQKISLNPLYPLNPCSHPSKRGVAEQILRKS